jgi:hypothetical protein
LSSFGKNKIAKKYKKHDVFLLFAKKSSPLRSGRLRALLETMPEIVGKRKTMKPGECQRKSTKDRTGGKALVSQALMRIDMLILLVE